jgi:hypothetical protein
MAFLANSDQLQMGWIFILFLLFPHSNLILIQMIFSLAINLKVGFISNDALLMLNMSFPIYYPNIY